MTDYAYGYSIYLKIQAAFWIPIFAVGYTLKWGVAWHNAGPPLEPFWNATFHPYWNMISECREAEIPPRPPWLTGNFAFGCRV